MDEKIGTFYLDEASLSLIVEALLTKIKENVNSAITKDGTEEVVWNTLVNGLSKGIIGETDNAKKAVSAELLAEIIAKANFMGYEIVNGTDIEAAVATPERNVIYLLKTDPAKNSVSMWMNIDVNGTSGWVSLGVAELPELKVINGTDSINNVVAHVNRNDTDYSSSTNVQAKDLVTAESLTQILVGLGYAKKKVVPYSESQGKTISETVGEPDVNTIYAFQQSDDNNDWAVYTAAPIKGDSNANYVWLKISGAEGSAPVEIDLSNYWSKNELTALSADDITAIVQSASEKVGL